MLVQQVANNDLPLARDLHYGLRYELHQFVFQRAAIHLGHLQVGDPGDLLDLYAKKQVMGKQTGPSAREKKLREEFWINPRERVGVG